MPTFKHLISLLHYRPVITVISNLVKMDFVFEITDFVIFGRNLPFYDVRKNSFPRGGIEKIKITIVFRQKIVILYTDSIFTK